MITRRTFLAMLPVLLMPRASEAQPVKKARIGYLSHSLASDTQDGVDAFRVKLGGLGYREGQDLVIEYRYAEGQSERLPQLAAELVRLKVDVMVTYATPASVLGKDIPRTRQILRRLLVGRMECEAFDEGQRVGYRFRARGSYAPLLPASLSTPEMVTPGRYARR